MTYKQIAEALNTNAIIISSFLKGEDGARTTLTNDQLMSLLNLYKKELEQISLLVANKLKQRNEVDLLLKLKLEPNEKVQSSCEDR